MEQDEIDRLIDKYTEKVMEDFGLSSKQGVYVATILAEFMEEITDEVIRGLRGVLTKSVIE